ncbi:hypothetical protein PENTCL1PPCAC_22788, partial [Pristionchus entomophagus]
PGAIHSLTGAISLLGVILQFTLAFIRPSPDSIIRPYFNSSHRLIGILSLLFALIATLIASNFFLKYWSDSLRPFLLTILASFLILLSFLLFQVVEGKLQRKRKDGNEEIDMSNGTSSISHSTSESIIRKILFILFFTISFTLSIYIALHLIA